MAKDTGPSLRPLQEYCAWRWRVRAIGEGRVRLGVTAPEDIRVDRQEIHERRTQSDVSDWGARGRCPTFAVPLE